MDPTALDASARDYLATHDGDTTSPASIRGAAIRLWGGDETFDPDVFERNLRGHFDDGGFQFVQRRMVVGSDPRPCRRGAAPACQHPNGAEQPSQCRIGVSEFAAVEHEVKEALGSLAASVGEEA